MVSTQNDVRERVSEYEGVGAGVGASGWRMGRMRGGGRSPLRRRRSGCMQGRSWR